MDKPIGVKVVQPVTTNEEPGEQMTLFGSPVVHGGAGSGNFGHSGRPGERGGSGGGGDAGGKDKWSRERDQKIGSQMKTERAISFSKDIGARVLSGKTSVASRKADLSAASSDLREAANTHPKDSEMHGNLVAAAEEFDMAQEQLGKDQTAFEERVRMGVDRLVEGGTGGTVVKEVGMVGGHLNYRELGQRGMFPKTKFPLPKSGQEVDYYNKDGDKKGGVVVKVDPEKGEIHIRDTGSRQTVVQKIVDEKTGKSVTGTPIGRLALSTKDRDALLRGTKNSGKRFKGRPEARIL